MEMFPSPENDLNEQKVKENDIKPIINCHTHIFTRRNVPPWLAKTYLFWPAYYLLHAGVLVRIIKWWVNEPHSIQYTNSGKQVEKIRFNVNYFLYRLNPIYQVIGWVLTLQAFFIFYDLLKKIIFPN